MSSRRRLLFLFDLSETLLYRADRRVAGAGGLQGRVNDKLIYLRPGALELFSALLSSENASVAFYTSLTRKNALQMVKLAVGGENYLPKVFAIFDRDFCVHDAQGKKPWDTKRSLEKVCNSSLVVEQANLTKRTFYCLTMTIEKSATVFRIP